MAVTAPILETMEYRIVIVLPESRAILTLNTSGDHQLPRVSIPRRMRPAQALRQAVETKWSLNVLILEYLQREDNSASCVMAELLTPIADSALDATPLDRVSRFELPDEERAMLGVLLNGECQSPFSRFGWVDEASAWLETATGQKVSSKSDIQQLNAGGAFTLLRFHTEDGTDYWMKATGDPNAHELSITSLLSRLSSGFVPRVIATKPDWNAWLMCGDGIPISELATDSVVPLKLLENAAESIAELQLRTIGHETELREAGAFDQSLATLLAGSEAIFAYIEEAMGAQTTTKVPRIARGRLQELRGILTRVCERLNSLNLPNAVLHGDLSLGNILVCDKGCQFIDWCEAYVGNPLITLEHLLLLNQTNKTELKASTDHMLRTKYRKVMAKGCDLARLDEGMINMPFLAAFSALYGRGDWLAACRPRELHRLAYARTLARVMDRAASDPILQSALRT